MEATRYARIQQSVAPLRSDGVTRCSSLRREVGADAESSFRDKQRMMASAVLEQTRPGLFVFAAHRKYGHLARLWLEASVSPRAGLIGRHAAVDLALPLDDALSLRHLMFVVRRQAAGVRFVVIDLESHNGLRLETEESARLVEAEGPLIVTASDFIFFCIPTGQPLPWDRDHADPWATLAPRRLCRIEPRQLPPTAAIAGRAEVSTGLGAHCVAISSAALRRGVLVGRAERCEVPVPAQSASRVHAVLLRLDDELLVIDAGSTNGLWSGDDEIRIAGLQEGEVLGLGAEATLCWRGAH